MMSVDVENDKKDRGLVSVSLLHSHSKRRFYAISFAFPQW
jgi:hypothetical protein